MDEERTKRYMLRAIVVVAVGGALAIGVLYIVSLYGLKLSSMDAGGTTTGSHTQTEEQIVQSLTAPPIATSSASGVLPQASQFVSAPTSLTAPSKSTQTSAPNQPDQKVLDSLSAPSH